MKNSYRLKMKYGFRRAFVHAKAWRLMRLALRCVAFGLLLAILSYSGLVVALKAQATETDAQAIQVKSIEDAARQVYRLLVEVKGAIKGGTGFLVSGQRVVATNHHVIENGTAYSVGFIDEHGVVKRIPLRVLAVFPQKDLALMEALDDLPGTALPLSTVYPRLAADIYAIGFPAAADPKGVLSWAQGDDITFFQPSVLKGIVSRVLTNRWSSSQLQHQTPIIPGYSGGPLIDEQGVILAISSSIHNEANGISYGVLAKDLSDMLEACSLTRENAVAGFVKGNTPSQGLPNAVSVTKFKAHEHTRRPDPTDLIMLQRGKDLLHRGDIVAARLIFRHLVDEYGLSDAYIGLAQTYDPIFLNDKNILSASGDAEKAREFYEKAGLTDQPNKQKRLPKHPRQALNGTCNGAVCELVNRADGSVVQCKMGGLPPAKNRTSHK